MPISALPFALLLFLAPLAQAATTPKEVATEFYSWVIKHSGGGLPSEASMLPAKAFMSTELITLFAAARVSERACVASTPPDLKPAIFEGNMFVESYEGVTHLISLRLTPLGSRIRVTSRLQYLEPQGQWAPVTWSDQFELVRESGRWVVGDVGGRSRTPKLVATLKKYIKGDC